MKLTVAMVVGLLLVFATHPAVMAAQGRVEPNSKVFIEESDFGKAFAAAILKKKLPILVIKDKEKATYLVETTSSATKEGSGERVAKVLAFGVFAGSGKTFEGTVTITNREGILIFAHNTKKGAIQKAAENVANELKKHIEGK